MKHLILLSLFTLNSSLFTLSASAAVPLRWTVETSRLAPAVFDVVRGETIALEAAFNSAGKPFKMDGEPVSVFWQTNGMGNAWWTAPAVATSNLVRATFTPEMDPGAATVNGFLGSSGSIYRAAFTFRFRHGPGALPNVLPLPVPVIDFAKVTVLNPPWSGGGGGVDTNAVRDIIREQLLTNGIRSVDGAARPLPKYLHIYDAADSYPDAAAEYYRSRGDGKVDGGCSSVRDGGFLYRNFDYPFDDRAEFVVKMAAGKDRFASVGVAQVGTNLTEKMVTSGSPEWSARYKWLPGATVDGINENGVVCEVNVVDGDPEDAAWPTNGTIHCLGAVRWVLDHATNAASAAQEVAAGVFFPSGWTQNFHWMIADERETWIVENGAASNVTAVAAKRVMTNFPILPDTYSGMGKERYQLLRGGEPITNAWFTRAYSPTTDWFTDFGRSAAMMEGAKSFWNDGRTKEQHRGETVYGQFWWQTVHTSVYDITNRTLRVAVQETDDWYTFAVPSAGGVKPEAVREIVEPMIGAATNNLRRVDDMAVYTNASVKTWSCDVPELLSALMNGGNPLEPAYDPDIGLWMGPNVPSTTGWYSHVTPGGPGLPASCGYTYHHGQDDQREAIAVFDRHSSIVKAADRIATTNGVAQAIEAATSRKIDREVIDDSAEWRSYRFRWDALNFRHVLETSPMPEIADWVPVFGFGAPGGMAWFPSAYNVFFGGDSSLTLGDLLEMKVPWGALANYVTKQELAAKQDALPYPTNAIPTDAISGLVQKIHDEAPAPGNYAAVSNAAMNAMQPVTNADANLIYTITSDSAEPRFYFTPVGAIDPED